MTIQLTDDHEQLRQYLTRFLGSRYDLERSRDAAKNGSGWQPEIWAAFADELGILGATFPADAGGDDGEQPRLLVITEALGRHLVVEPFIDTVVLCGTLLAELGSTASYDDLRQIASGKGIWALAALEPASGHSFHDVTTTARRDGAEWVIDGVKTVVTSAPIATDLLVTVRTAGERRDKDGLSVVRIAMDTLPDGLTVHSMRTYDDRVAADLSFEGARLPSKALVGAEGAAWPAIDRAVDAATAAICGEAVGCMRRLLDDTVEYAKQREQFGQPISRFQALQHRMVDMYLQTEQASAAAELAFSSLGSDPAARRKAVSAAKATVALAARIVGQEAVQLHGGMGMTEELAVGHYFKRLTAIETEYGGREQHLARYRDPR